LAENAIDFARSGMRFSLSLGERAGVRASVPLTIAAVLFQAETDAFSPLSTNIQFRRPIENNYSR
jgi:hypothetical protein